MKLNMNVWSFILSFICFGLFIVATSFGGLISIVKSTVDVHPLTIVLGLTLLTLILGVLGFMGIKDWKSMARSIFTILFTLVFSGIITFIIFIGSVLD